MIEVITHEVHDANINKFSPYNSRHTLHTTKINGANASRLQYSCMCTISHSVRIRYNVVLSTTNYCAQFVSITYCNVTSLGWLPGLN